MTNRSSGLSSTISNVYSNRRPRKRATREIRLPTRRVPSSSLLASVTPPIHDRSLPGSVTNAAIDARSRSMMVSVETLTDIGVPSEGAPQLEHSTAALAPTLPACSPTHIGGNTVTTTPRKQPFAPDRKNAGTLPGTTGCLAAEVEVLRPSKRCTSGQRGSIIQAVIRKRTAP